MTTENANPARGIPAPVDLAVDETARPADSPNSARRPKVNRVSFPLTADEKAINVGSMEPANQARLRSLITPELMTSLGISAPAARNGEPIVRIKAEWCGVIYDALSSVQMSVWERAGYTREQVEVLAVSLEEKAELGPLTAEVIAELLPTTASKYEKLIVLLALYGSMMAGKTIRLRKTAPVIALVPESKGGAA